MAEIAYLTIQELGLEFVGVLTDKTNTQTFLKYPVRELLEVSTIDFDGIIVASLEPREQVRSRLVEAGIPHEKIILIPDRRGRPAVEMTGSLAISPWGKVSSLEQEPVSSK